MKSPFRSFLTLAMATACAMTMNLAPAAETPPIYGFTPAGLSAQNALEKKFDSLLNKDNLREWMQFMTRKPHHLGSPYDKEVAEFIAEKFKSWGYETKIEEFEVLFPTPQERLVELLAPEKFTARLAEPTLNEDGTSGVAGQLPPYNAFSADGDVTGELVYVNFGVPKDYETLAEHGIDVKGKIVIARYGGSWRGIKPKVAAEKGAIGCIIYSDPHEDGYYHGDVYPKGSWRNEQGAQRGSVADMPLYPGDPLTPGIGATKDAKRLPLTEAATLTKIPVLPLSYADALPLLKSLGGAVAPEGWRGALPITYHFGPGPARVRLKLKFDWKTVTLRNVIARWPGKDAPDQWIIRGNHHDAWVFGADDPVSGAVETMEEARVLAELAKAGSPPKRTVIFTLWDGEEEGLFGSTEWCETHADELRHKAVTYINGDNNGRGFFRAGGSHTLERFVSEVARDVVDPQTRVSAAERLLASRIASASPSERPALRSSREFRLSALGSGSDYTPFLQHLGIASLDLRYGGEDEGGSYHSTYDSFDHYVRFGDPGFAYGITLAQTSGRAVLRLANADYLPFDFSRFAATTSRYLQELIRLVNELREETVEHNRLISDRTLELARDPHDNLKSPEPQEPVPYLNFAPMQNAVARLQSSAERFASATKRLATSSATPAMEKLSKLNVILGQCEQSLTRNEGLPRRPWYRHQIYAPGFYTGYGVKTIPGVREAIEERQWDEALAQLPIAASVIEKFAGEIDRATAVLEE